MNLPGFKEKFPTANEENEFKIIIKRQLEEEFKEDKTESTYCGIPLTEFDKETLILIAKKLWKEYNPLQSGFKEKIP